MAKKSRKPEAGKKILSGTDIGKQADGKVPYLETTIDRFYRLVKEKKSINFYDAAIEQGVTKEQIASWAKILEDHKLAKVHYPVFGAPVILIEAEKQLKGTKAKVEEGAGKTPGKRMPKIVIALFGGLMVLFGYVMLVSNPFTITLRAQMTALGQRFMMPFGFFPYPLNIIIPLIIVIAVLWIVFVMRRARKSAKERPAKEKRAKEKKEGRGIEDKLSKIKKELGS